uniref:WH1 domain-containing protein n=1 Tax=Globisporangium ultimum (strain ATCC 200006 / CBS 805.95 / DAOM BR144) TaxID=431595 RepID=K3WX48_GLOUD
MSEVVVYTTIAAVYSKNNSSSSSSNVKPQMDEHVMQVSEAGRTSAAVSSASTINIASGGLPQRALRSSPLEPSMKWTPIADGAWAQIHLFLEMESELNSAKKQKKTSKQTKGVLKKFRIVAWILDTGKVIVNDIVRKGCKWEQVSGGNFRKFTGITGQVYGFGFRNALQAAECSHFINQILSNTKAIKRFVKKLFCIQLSTRDYLSLLPDMGLNCMRGNYIQEH